MEAKHAIGIIPLTFIKMMERMAYYGMRSLLVFYMLHTLAFSSGQIGTVFTVFTAMTALLPLVGGLIGDLLAGIRISVIIGLSLEAAGCFMLAMPGIYAFYSGMFMISLGLGFYGPNFMSAVNLTYRPRKKLMDAAFFIIYAAVNAGAFIGPTVFTLVTWSDDMYWIGFVAAGVLILLSLIIFIFTNNLLTDVPRRANIYAPKQASFKSIRSASVIFIMIALPLFWAIMQLSDDSVYETGRRIAEEDGKGWLNSFMYSIPTVVIAVLGGLSAIVWSFFYVRTSIKIVLGFALFAISAFLLSATLSPVINNSMYVFLITGLVLQGLGEMFIAPAVISYICQHTSLRFNATLIAVSGSGTYVLAMLLSFFAVYTREIPFSILGILLGIMALVSGGLFFLFNWIAQKEDAAE